MSNFDGVWTDKRDSETFVFLGSFNSNFFGRDKPNYLIETNGWKPNPNGIFIRVTPLTMVEWDDK